MLQGSTSRAGTCLGLPNMAAAHAPSGWQLRTVPGALSRFRHACPTRHGSVTAAALAFWRGSSRRSTGRFRSMSRHLALLALAPVLLAAPAHAAVGLTLFDSGFSAPVYLNGRGSNVYVVQQGGTILQINGNRPRRAAPSSPYRESRPAARRGCSASPSIRTTAPTGGSSSTSRRGSNGPAGHRSPPLHRTVRSSHRGTRSSILRFNQPYDNHNGGWIEFGARQEPVYRHRRRRFGQRSARTMRRTSPAPLGKLLRINVQKAPMAIPNDPD